MAKNQNNNVAPATQKTDPGAKKDALATALAQIEKQFGKGAVMKLGDNAAMQVDAISTGSIGLDLALGVGGVPRGRIIEVYGPESSGKTTLALHVLAEAQKKGGDVAFIDVEHALDPVYAEALGVDINNLLVSQPDTGEQAMEICEALVRSGAIDAIVVDSVAAMVPRAENEGEIAAFISTPYLHGNFFDNQLPADGYWQKVRELCTKNGIVLIVDDVRAGFRLDIAGSDHFYGFEADLICFCKALANGWNVSALCGKEFLKSSISSLSYTGSYWLSAIPFAAGIACINKMKKLNTPAIFREKGLKVGEGLKAAAANNGFHLVVSGEPSLFYLRLADDDSLMLHQEWIAEMVKRGIFLTSHHNHFLNASLTDEDIAHTVDVAEDAFNTLRKNHPELA